MTTNQGVDSLDRDDAAEGVADFDAFFAEQAAAGPQGVSLRLYGKVYTLPAQLPMMFALQLERVRDSEDPEDIRRLVGMLFGQGALDDFIEGGMTDEQFSVLLIWAMANCAEPHSLSMEEAAARYREQDEAKASGKAPAARKKAAKKTATSRKPAAPRAKRASSGKRS